MVMMAESVVIRFAEITIHIGAIAQSTTVAHRRRRTRPGWPVVRWAGALTILAALAALGGLVASASPLTPLSDRAVGRVQTIMSAFSSVSDASDGDANPSPGTKSTMSPAAASTDTVRTLPATEPDATSPAAAVPQDNVDLCAGPATTYAVLQVLSAGDTLAILGKTQVGDWYMVRTEDGLEGWALADLLTTGVTPAALPVLQTPPEPPAASAPSSPPQPSQPAAADAPAIRRGSASARGANPAPAPRVTAVGDSVMLSAAGPLEQAIGNVDLDAVVGRQVPGAIEILRARRAAGQLGDVVIVHIGNNGPLSDTQFDEMMAVLADVRQVVFVNLKVPRRWEEQDNAVLAAGVARYQGAVLVDWHDASVNRPELFWDDGVHLRPQGTRLYADLIAPFVIAP